MMQQTSSSSMAGFIMPDALQQFESTLTARGIVPGGVIADGALHRCPTEGKPHSDNGAYLLHLDGAIPAGGYQNWGDNLGWQDWRADIGRKLTKEENAAYKAQMEASRKAKKEEEERRHTEARERAMLILAESTPCTAHPYLAKKGVQAHGVKVAPDGRLIIPMRDAAGKLHSLQRIAPDGNKLFLKGGRVDGCYFAIGKPTDVLYIVEGYATGASIHEATGCAVAVAFNAGNLEAVAKALREKLPDIRIVICADDDYQRAGNPGLTAARKAAKAIGGLVAIPDFGDMRPDGATDFNDLHQAQGIEAVKRSIENALSANSSSSSGDPEPLASDDDVEYCPYGDGRFERSRRGVFFMTGKKDDAGNDKPPVWICSPLWIVAKTRDTESGAWGRRLKWIDDDGVCHHWSMPSSLLEGDGLAVRQELTDKGLHITPSKYGRELLSTYIKVWTVEERARCVDRLGWNGGVFVTPSETIGADDEMVVFQNAQAIEPAFSTKGTLDEWRANVASRAVGNSRVVFAISAAFAGALADMANEDSGGFHFLGASSSGKSTAQKIAGSVWGHPEKYWHSWRATANGLEGLSAIHNDGLLILDEISMADSKEVGEAAYMLANGQGKTRAGRTGMARQSFRWRLLFLSSGEEGLSTYMAKAGKKPNAGQQVRLAEIDADAGAGMGAFENLHGIENSKEFSEHLKEIATHAYGTAGMEWLRCLVEHRERLTRTHSKNMKSMLELELQAFLTENAPDAGGQVGRVARRFALVAVAGELATEWGITGWEPGESERAAGKCFAAWLEGWGGNGNKEERATLEQVKAFFEAHGASRFEEWEPKDPDKIQRIVNRAGFVRHVDGMPKYYVLNEMFKLEVCKGIDHIRAARVLLDAGWIEPGYDGRTSKPERLPGLGKQVKCYVFTEKMWTES